VVALVQREQAAHAEQHDRDDERVDVTLAPVTERMFLGRPPPTSSSPWLLESATEWIASASIDDDPVSRKATNFVTAIPMFAAKAVTTALVLPSALTARPL
jgi:hypothetical protein